MAGPGILGELRREHLAQGDCQRVARLAPLCWAPAWQTLFQPTGLLLPPSPPPQSHPTLQMPTTRRPGTGTLGTIARGAQREQPVAGLQADRRSLPSVSPVTFQPPGLAKVASSHSHRRPRSIPRRPKPCPPRASLRPRRQRQNVRTTSTLAWMVRCLGVARKRTTRKSSAENQKPARPRAGSACLSPRHRWPGPLAPGAQQCEPGPDVTASFDRCSLGQRTPALWPERISWHPEAKKWLLLPGPCPAAPRAAGPAPKAGSRRAGPRASLLSSCVRAARPIARDHRGHGAPLGLWLPPRAAAHYGWWLGRLQRLSAPRRHMAPRRAFAR